MGMHLQAHLDGCAGPVDRSIALITLPSAPMGFNARVHRYLSGNALGEHKAGDSSQERQNNLGVNGKYTGLLFSLHGSSHSLGLSFNGSTRGFQHPPKPRPAGIFR